MLKRELTLLLTLFALAGLLGCSLTGGGVPIGNPGPTRLIGTVIDEDEPSVPLADAEIEITVEDGTKINVKTDASGTFIAQLPRNKRCVLKVRPSGELETLYQEWVGDFVADADEIRLLIPLPRKGTTMPSFADLQIQPQKVVLSVGGKVRFEIHLVPPPQRPIQPVWSVHGGVGVITPDGLFVATRPGQGVIRVRVGHLRSEAVVIVTPSSEVR